MATNKENNLKRDAIITKFVNDTNSKFTNVESEYKAADTALGVKIKTEIQAEQKVVDDKQAQLDLSNINVGAANAGKFYTASATGGLELVDDTSVFEDGAATSTQKEAINPTNNAKSLIENDNTSKLDANVGSFYQGDQSYGSNSQGEVNFASNGDGLVNLGFGAHGAISVGEKAHGEINIGSDTHADGDGFGKLVHGAKEATFEEIIDKAKESGGGVWTEITDLWTNPDKFKKYKDNILRVTYTENDGGAQGVAVLDTYRTLGTIPYFSGVSSDTFHRDWGIYVVGTLITEKLTNKFSWHHTNHSGTGSVTKVEVK